MFGGLSFARRVETGRAPVDAVRILAAPGFGPRRANPSTSCMGLVIAAGSKTAPEAAWALVEWLALGEPARQRFAGGLGFPAARAALDHAAPESALLRQAAAAAQKEAAGTQAVCIQTSAHQDNDLLALAWTRQEERYLTGQVSFDEMLTAVEEEVRLATRSEIQLFG